LRGDPTFLPIDYYLFVEMNEISYCCTTIRCRFQEIKTLFSTWHSHHKGTKRNARIRYPRLYL